MNKQKIAAAQFEEIHDCIYFIRGKRVMLDHDLARLYQVTTANLNKAVKRNAERFPTDFMFPLTEQEHLLIFQSGISNASGRGGRRRSLPYAFTQEGIAMLSGILRSPRAVEVNIAVMRAFVKMREVLSANRGLARKLEELENKLIAHDYEIEEIVQAIRSLMQPPEKSPPRIGYKP